MSTEEKLIELLQGSRDKYLNLLEFEKGLIARYLVENNTIVPPVKVGGKVYKIGRNKVKECEVVFIGISADERCSYFNFVENYADGTFKQSYSMVFDVIGKSIFLTKEEAEKSLRESKI